MLRVRTPPLGSLNERIEFLAAQTAIAEGGGHETLFNSVGTAWAKVLRSDGRPDAAGDGRGAFATHSVVVRFRTDISPGDRVTYRGEMFEILSVGDLNGRRAYLECRCRQREVRG